MARGQLVGRHAELGMLADALAEAAAGDGGLVLLVGEPGIGKSRLVEETARLASEAGMAVAWGRAWEAGGAPPYWPWIQVLRGFEVAAAQKLVDARGGEDRFLLFDDVGRDLLLHAGTPAVALLEDLHAADEASLHLLAFLAPQLRGTSLLVVGTYRDVEARTTPAANAVLERVARAARVIAPRRLEPMDVVELAAEHALDAETIAALHRQSEGNPLFVTELLRVIGRRGGVPAGAPLPVPAGVRSAIREHLRGVPPALLPILEAAAAIGREQTAAIVADVCGVAMAGALDAMQTAVELGVLVERGGGRFVFSHGLIAETLHHDLPAERRMQLHAAVAATLERAHAGDPSAPLAEIAHHLLEAGPAHAERAAEVAWRAAEQARRQLAFEPAAALVERALAIVPATNPRLRFELLRMLGEVRMLADDVPRGKEACRDAAAIAQALESPELLARAALTYGIAHQFGVTDQALVQLLEEALGAQPPGDSPLRARMMARLAGALQPALDTRQPMELAREAIAMADRIGDPRTRLEVTHAAMAGLMLVGPPAERRTHGLVVRELAARLDEPVLALRAELRLVFDHCELGDIGGITAHLSAYDALVERLRLPRARWPSAMVRAMLALVQGRLADHAAALAEAHRLADEAGDPFLRERTMRGHRLGEHLVLGDDEALARDRAQHATFAHVTGKFVYREVLALLAVRLGELDEARALLTREHVEFVAAHRVVRLANWAAEVIWRLGAADLAAILYDALAREGARFGMLQMHGFGIEQPAAYGAMLLAATQGDVTAARRHFEVAAAAVRALDAHPLSARLHLDWATILIDHGADAGEARRVLATAREHAGATKLGPKIDAALARLARLAGAPAAGAEPVHYIVDVVRLRCEGELWSVEGLGTSCRVKASRGVEMLAKLVGEPNRELHVLDLAADADGAADAGDSGEALDAEARAAYRRRIVELREALDEAERWNDVTRAERVRDELETIEAELVRATGLGGKPRRVGRAAERARSNVQRRLADAIKRITEVAPAIGQHLAAAVKTGVYCSYAPERASRRA